MDAFPLERVDESRLPFDGASFWTKGEVTKETVRAKREMSFLIPSLILEP